MADTIFDCLLLAHDINAFLRKKPVTRIEPTITFRGVLVDALTALIYREGWHKAWKYKLALRVLWLIR